MSGYISWNFKEFGTSSLKLYSDAWSSYGLFKITGNMALERTGMVLDNMILNNHTLFNDLS